MIYSTHIFEADDSNCVSHSRYQRNESNPTPAISPQTRDNDSGDDDNDDE